MALTPEQASQLGQGDFDEVQKFEKDLDMKLLSNFNTITGRFDYVFAGKGDTPTKVRFKVILEIQRRYVAAGWQVQLLRDGEDCVGMLLHSPDAPPPLQPPTAHQRLMAKDTGTAE